MKRLALLVIIIVLPIIAYFQYSRYSRFQTPGDYDYAVNDSIDVHYHDQQLLQQYYKNVYEIGTFARSNWHTYKIDVRFPDMDDIRAQQAADYYQQLLKTTALQEDKLIYSKVLKAQGFDNQEIAEIERQGLSPQSYRLSKTGQMLGLQRGDKGENVWELQKVLQKKGYELPADGVFDIITENALKTYQEAEGLYPSGQVTESSLRELLYDL